MNLIQWLVFFNEQNQIYGVEMLLFIISQDFECNLVNKILSIFLEKKKFKKIFFFKIIFFKK